MNQLLRKLTEYLEAEYSQEEITAQLMDADICNVTSTKLDIIYDNGVIEKLKLKDGKLIQRESPKIPRKRKK